MYLRTTQRKNKDGSVARYFQLAHNVRAPGSSHPTATIIHNFGRAEEVDRADLVRLCESIARVVGLEVRDPLAGKVAPVARDILPAGVEQVVTREYGVVLAVQSLWKELGIDRTLVAAGGPEVERALFAIVCNRLAEPSSKLGVWERWLRTVHLPDAWDLALDRMYSAMDVFREHQDQVERTVFFETANLMNLVVDLVFYDTTTCSFSIDDTEHDDLRTYGYSKGGTWTAQVVVALAVTREGIPVRSWVLPGNTADVSTIAQVKADLREWKLGRVLLVGDAGMNSEDNRQTLARACGTYVLACRPSGVTEIQEEVLSRAGRYKEIRSNLRVKEVIVGDGELRRRYVVCHNPERAERERLHREQAVADLEAEFATHKDRDARRKWVAQVRTSGRYGKYVSLDDAGRLCIDREAIRAAERLDGKWVLVTNDDTLTAADVADAYHSQQIVERGFRMLKSEQIDLSPVFHHRRTRIEAHIKLCVLALLIARVLELRAKRPWSRMRDTLRELQVTEYRTETHRFFRANTPSESVSELLGVLGIEPPKPVVGVTSLT